jgi:F-type H+-transporting ATPase subunit b
MLDPIITTFRNMGVDWRLILVNAVNFGIVAAVIYYFGFRPVLKTMDERKKKIEDGLQYAEEMKKKLEEASVKEAEILKEARQEAQAIIEKARVAAKGLEEKQTQDTAAKIEQMLARGREAIEQERRKTFDELRGEIARLVVLTTSKVLTRDLADAEKAKINAHAAEELAKTN